MAKLKAPLLSLGAHGSVAKSLTFREHDGITIAERTPVLKDARTLKQIYQRWLYQDYIAYWHDQTPATKLLYETNARPFHMTGFAYWMRTMLNTMPDIGGAWHLDEGAGATIHDYGKNGNNGTIYNATWVDGRIGKALAFNGTTAFVNIPATPSLDITGPFTLEIWFRRTAAQDVQPIITKGTNFGGQSNYYLIVYLNSRLFFDFWAGGVRKTIEANNPNLGLNLWNHYAGVYDGNYQRIYVNGLLDNSTLRGSLTLDPSANPLRIGRENDSWNKGTIDEPRLTTRALTAADILRHALRRYP